MEERRDGWDAGGFIPLPWPPLPGWKLAWLIFSPISVSQEIFTLCQSENGPLLPPVILRPPLERARVCSSLTVALMARKPVTPNHCHILMCSVTGKNFSFLLPDHQRGGRGHMPETIVSCLPTRGVCAAAVPTADRRHVAAEAVQKALSTHFLYLALIS